MQKAPYFCAVEKRKCVSDNAFTFEVKRPCVLIKTLWRFKPNARTFSSLLSEA